MSKATRQAFGEALEKLGGEFKNIVVLDADLSKSTKSELFAKKYPERFVEMGIAEANMIGTAAGLAFAGKLPFLCSFGAFISGRYDTIRLSVAYAQANVRLIGTHSGLGIGDDGHSQMGLEDISLMRALPTMGVFQPMDAQDTANVMEYLVREWKGPAYLRLTRQNLPDYTPAGVKFQPLKLMQVLGGAERVKVVCVASGAGVAEAMGAAQILKNKGISMSVWNAHCLKPFDEATTLQIAENADLFITVEDHSVIGGLGTCVAEALAKATRHPELIKFGCQDQFGESGDPAELFEKHGFSAKAIAEKIAHRFNQT